MDLTNSTDVSLAIRIAQHSKQTLSDRYQVDLGELTQRSTLLVRVEVAASRVDPSPRIFDFVELPATNMLSSRPAGSFYSLK